jgi:hypothetical protein
MSVATTQPKKLKERERVSPRGATARQRWQRQEAERTAIQQTLLFMFLLGKDAIL